MADEILPELRTVVTRAEAKAAGLKRYFTGLLCKHAHVSERVTMNGACVACRDQTLAAFCEVHKDRRNKSRAERHAQNPEHKRRQKRLLRLSKLNRERERDRLVGLKFRGKILERALQWQRDNPEKVRAREALRR